MKENVFKTDAGLPAKKTLSRRVNVLMGAAIILTGVCSAAGVRFFIGAVRDDLWNTMEHNLFAWKSLMFLCFFCIFIALAKMTIDMAIAEKPFSKTLSACLWCIGGLFLAASVLFPRLSGYQIAGFVIFSKGSFVLIDGMVLVPGILFLILGSLIQIGFEMQKEIEEIL